MNPDPRHDDHDETEPLRADDTTSPDNTARPPSRDPAVVRGKAQAIAAILGLSLINGMLVTKFGGGLEVGNRPMDLLTAMALFAVGFWWLHLDGRETGHRRSVLFNIGIVLLALLFVPLYFIQSRPSGERWQPVLGFLGLILASSVAAAIGAMMAGVGSSTAL